MSEKIKRIFIAIKIPVNYIFQNYFESLRSLLKDEDIKWVLPENLHITLAYIGECSNEIIDVLDKQISADLIDYSAFCIDVEVVGVFENKNTPQILWFEIKASEIIMELYKNISFSVLEHTHFNKKEKFVPHITLGRIEKLKSNERLFEVLNQFSKTSIMSFSVNEILMYQSILRQHGPKYNVLKRFSLKKPL